MFGPAPVVEQPNWKYVSIDIETLGLDSEYSDIIEFGAVLDDFSTPFQDLPRFHCYITKDYDKYQGEAYAMSMHADILRRIAKRSDGYTYVSSDCLDENFSVWLKQNGVDEIVVVGKNFATFDLKFLQKIGFGKFSNIHRRILDLGSMFYTPKDKVPPNLEECLRRSGVEKKVNHTAVEDALDVVSCIRYKYCS
jgi:oligoribonuclease (3'-5' exoribonuclease)